MNVQTLRVLLEHLPDDLPVQIAGRGELCSVRRHGDQFTDPAVFLDVRGPLLRGRFHDARTLRVRLEGLGVSA